jgi:hypothetical protein
MGNANTAIKPALALDQLLKHSNSTNTLGDLNGTSAILNRNTRGVVASVLKALQALKKKGGGWFLADVSDDSTHGRRVPCRSNEEARISQAPSRMDIVVQTDRLPSHTCLNLWFNSASM